jgi:adenosylmethionine-8-amino-7-oxononanoate aminotransferase
VTFIDFPHKGKELESIDQFKHEIANNQTAAFIFEPLVQAAGGMRMYTPSVLNELIKLAQANDIICIADEVITGFGRTGKLFACDHLEYMPDIMTLSKGLTGGTMPLGVTTCNNKIVKAFESHDFIKTFFHGHSYTANPLACAVANASFELLMNKTCQSDIERISARHLEFKNRILNHPKISNVRTLGTIFALELKNNEETSYTNSARKKIYNHFLEQNILLRPLGNVIYILPPYITNNHELEKVYLAIQKFIDTY